MDVRSVFERLVRPLGSASLATATNVGSIRRLTETGNKMKIGSSVLLGDEDEEVGVHGKPNCGDIGRRRRWVACW
jgi:hypothetical protein